MIRLLFAILLLLAGCGNESVNEAKPSPGDVSYSSSPEIDLSKGLLALNEFVTYLSLLFSSFGEKKNK